MLTRRTVCGGIAALPLIGAGPAGFPDETAWASLDKRTGRVSGERADRRMPMCSSFKWLLAACVLARVDRSAERLDRLVRFGPGDMLDASPVTKAAFGGKAEVSLTVATLCAATVGTSDNAAANLLLPSVGGPAGLTRWLRSIGDPATRLDRTEPELNRVLPGDPRDTTTPAAMLRDVDRLLYGPVLQSASRERLLTWMLATTTGPTRLRAGPVVVADRAQDRHLRRRGERAQRVGRCRGAAAAARRAGAGRGVHHRLPCAAGGGGSVVRRAGAAVD